MNIEAVQHSPYNVAVKTLGGSSGPDIDQSDQASMIQQTSIKSSFQEKTQIQMCIK